MATPRVRAGKTSRRSNFAPTAKVFPFVDLENDVLEDVGRVDLVFDVIGGDIGKRSAGLIRAGGTLVSIVGLAVDFVVESNRAHLSEII